MKVSVVVGLAALGAASALAAYPPTRALRFPQPLQATPTDLPTLHPTPVGDPVIVATPLATASPAPDAIGARNVARLAEVVRLAVPAGADENAVTFTRDGRWMLSSGTATWVRRSSDGALAEWLPAHLPLAFTPDGRFVLLADPAGGLRLWGRRGGREARWHQGVGSLTEVGFSPDGSSLLAMASDGWLRVWDMASGQTVRAESLSPTGWPVPSAVHPREPWIAIASPDGRRVTVQDVRSGEVRDEWSTGLPDAYELAELTWSPDGDALAGVASTSRAILLPSARMAYVWFQDGTAHRLMRDSVRQTGGLSWSATGHRLAVVEMRDWPVAAHVAVWDGGALTDVALPAASHIAAPTWSADGSLLALGWENWDTDTSATVLWDLAGAKEATRIADAVEPLFSPDGSRLVVRDHTSGELLLYGVEADPSPGTGTPTTTPERSAALVYGRVTRFGSAVADARVYVHNEAHRCQWSALTDAQGRFGRTCFDTAAQDVIRLRVVHPDYMTWAGEADIGRPMEVALQQLTVTATPTANAVCDRTKDGFAVDALAGWRIADVRIEAAGPVGGDVTVWSPVWTDDTGTFEMLFPRVDWMAPITFRAMADGFQPGEMVCDTFGYHCHPPLELALQRLGAPTPTPTATATDHAGATASATLTARPSETSRATVSPGRTAVVGDVHIYLPSAEG